MDHQSTYYRTFLLQLPKIILNGVEKSHSQAIRKNAYIQQTLKYFVA